MSFISGEQLVQQLRWRYAVKKFDKTQKVSDKDFVALEESLILTPSSYGLQPWKFIVVTNAALRDKLKPHSWNQSQITDASHLVVFAARTDMVEKDIQDFLQSIITVRGGSLEALSTYGNMMISDLVKGPRHQKIKEWAACQTYIALGNLMTSAALMGIDTCPLEGIDPEKYDEILALQETPYHTLCACAVGYRHVEDKYAAQKKVRFAKSKIIDERK